MCSTREAVVSYRKVDRTDFQLIIVRCYLNLRSWVHKFNKISFQQIKKNQTQQIRLGCFEIFPRYKFYITNLKY